MRQQKRTNRWPIIIGAVLLLHLAFFLMIKPSFFLPFKKDISISTDPSGSSSNPNAIFTIPIEIEDDADTPEDQQPTPKPTENPLVPEETRKKAQQQPGAGGTQGSSPEHSLNIENLLGEAPVVRPHGGGMEGVVIPPRPVEISWPDTRELQHCLDRRVDIRIHVDEEGTITDLEVVASNHPADCVNAALESAKRIVFEPGERDGKPHAMWTQIRIDFRRKR